MRDITTPMSSMNSKRWALTQTPAIPTQQVAPVEEGRAVRKLNLPHFRDKLIEHFSLKWIRKEVQWPSRNGRTVWVPSETMRLQALEMGIEL